jgi:hypothetical protein
MSPAIVKSGLMGNAVYIDEKGKPFNIHRRTGIGWPDEAISTGKTEISFELYRLPGSKLTIETAAVNAKAVPSNIALQIDGTGKLTASGKILADSIPEKFVTPVKLMIDMDKGSYVVNINGSISPEIQFDNKKAAFNGLNFRCYKNAAYIDNINMYIIKM